MRYDLTSLEIFVAVAETANLTRAAEQQHLAVSAISKRITELEGLAGAPLLQRHARGVSLTPAGQSMLHYPRQVRQLMHRMHGELSEYAGGLKGVIWLHASTSALVEFLPPELKSFLERYPMIRLQIEERTGAANRARRGRWFRRTSASWADHTPLRGLEALPYHSDRLALGVPRTHALARRTSMRFADALACDFVAPHAAGHEALGRLHMVRLKDAWAERQIVMAVRDLDSMPFTTRALIEHLRTASSPAA